MVFFLLSLRESASGNGHIEPDIPSSSLSSLLPSSSSNTNKSPPRWQDSDFKSYITTWDFEDRPALFRRLICILGLVLHLPINGISILSYKGSLWLFAGIVISLLNLACVGIALWKMDVMRGERRFWGKVYGRRHFDYLILGLVVVYGFFFGMLVLAKMRHSGWVWFIRIAWPFTIGADVVCFISGWVATWRDVSLG